MKLPHRYQTEGKKLDFTLDAGMEKENLSVYLQYQEHETVPVFLIIQMGLTEYISLETTARLLVSHTSSYSTHFDCNFRPVRWPLNLYPCVQGSSSSKFNPGAVQKAHPTR